MALALALVMTICSCQQAEVVPELLEPAVGGTTFRAVKRGTIGETKLMYGTIVPTDYCHFYKKMVKISNIYVEVGQYVEKGDLLAEADLKSVRSQLEDVYAEIELLEANRDRENKVYDSTLVQLDYEKNWVEYQKNLGFANEEAVKAVEKKIEETKENHEYEEALYKYMKSKYNESINDLNEVIEDGTLRAKSSGYVTYTKNLKNGSGVNVNENVVIVSDYEDTYILTDATTTAYQYRKYEYKKAFVHDKRIDIEEFDYTDSEISFSHAQNIILNQRFKFKEDTDLKIGDKVVLIFYKKARENVLYIGVDSSYSDEMGKFVYVETENGETEKRYYEAGEKSKYYIEVVSGLEEGDRVLYEQDSAKPIDSSDSIVAERKDVSKTEELKGIKHSEKNTVLYEAEDKGVINKIYVSSQDEVKKGDVLYEITIDSEKGKLTEIGNKIKHLEQNYKAQQDSLAKQKEDIEKAIGENQVYIDINKKNLEEAEAEIASGNLSDKELAETMALIENYKYSINALYNSTDMFNRGTLLLEEDLKCIGYDMVVAEKEYKTQKAMLTKAYNEQKAENNGTGYKKVYAERDGVVNTVYVSENERVEVGASILYTTELYDDLYWPGTTFKDMPVGYNFKVTSSKRSYEATVLGPNSRDSYLFTEDDKVYGTNSDKESLRNFTIRVEDEDFAKEQLSELKAVMDIYHYDSFVVVPGDYVFKEVTYDKKESFFVWKEEDGDIVKEFVIKGNEANGTLGNDGAVVIIEGVEVGDILVK